ncbi:hypothetical protein BRADI_1g11757v3 [Brachypodium distachyon]|uniref:Uncharacterized protein n=1 Tax=Brachypodium distachyon TaxID=15368 RepID=A0A0Q3KRK2_BRADI|nr:hypothetical protein BRADI_1g11757v3 [Brachypodium distachyon]
MCRVPAGGAEEVTPVWILRAAVSSSVSGAPVELCHGSVLLLVLLAIRSCGARQTLAGVREAAAPGVVACEGARGGVQDGALMEQDGGSPEPRTDDFPTAQGLLPIQDMSGGVAAARHRHVLSVVHEAGIQKNLLVILSLFWIFL